MPRAKWLVLVAATIAAVVAVAPAASATVFCVDAGGTMAANSIDPSCETPKLSIQAALTSAETQAGEDTVLVGPGDYTLPAKPGEGEVVYEDTNSGNVVHLRGVDSPRLKMGSTTATTTGVEVIAPAGSTVEGLQITIPANADGSTDFGLWLEGGTVGRDLRVVGPEATNAQAVVLLAGTKLENSTVDMPVNAVPTNVALAATGGDAAVSGSTLRGYTGINSSGNVFTVDRTRIDAHFGNETDGGTIVYRDSLIDLGGREGAVGVDLANGNMGTLALHAVIEGTTIVNGGSFSVGVRVQANDGSETADATISNALISGVARPLEIRADNGRTAKAKVSFSNYDLGDVVLDGNLDGSGASGLAEAEQVGITNFEPEFVSAGTGGFHLLRASKLIDAGDLAPPPGGELDLDGNPRAANPDCPPAAGRRDIGAYEFVPTCTPPTGGGGAGDPGGGGGGATGPGAPDTRIAGKRRVVSAKTSVKLTFSLSSPGAAVGYRCSVDGKPFRACGPKFSLSLKRGRHTIKVAAVGADGVADPTPATLVVRIVKKRPHSVRS